MKFRKMYDGLNEEASIATGLDNFDPSKTVQSDAVDADINTIVKRFGLTGEMPTNVRVPLDTDFADAYDFRTAMDAIVAAERSFAAMPAEVRKRFGNDPAEFVEFCGNPDNIDEMIKLGLAIKKPAEVIPPPMKVEIVEKENGTKPV